MRRVLHTLSLLSALWAVGTDDRPGYHEGWRFPEREHAWAMVRFADAHLTWLEHQMLLYPWRHDLESQWADTRWRRDVWWWVTDCHAADVGQRRNGLKKLREMIGHEAFGRGRLPEPVPLHLFEVIR